MENLEITFWTLVAINIIIIVAIVLLSISLLKVKVAVDNRWKFYHKLYENQREETVKLRLFVGSIYDELKNRVEFIELKESTKIIEQEGTSIKLYNKNGVELNYNNVVSVEVNGVIYKK